MPDPARATVLVVDDVPEIRRIIGEILGHARFDVVEASTGEEALARAAEGPDVIVLDVRLPDIDGREVCRRLKAAPATMLIPILQISGHFVSGADVAAGLEGGADAYLTKPLDWQELTATVKALLRTRRALSRLQETQARFRRAIDGAPMLVVGVDAEGRIVLFNAACEALTGYPQEEVLGWPLLALVPERSRDDARCRLAELAASGGAGPYRLSWVTKLGEERVIEWLGFVVPGGERLAFHLSMGHDVTAQSLVERRQATQFMVTRVLAGSTSRRDAMPRLLEALCRGLDWDAGELWACDPGAGVLRREGAWHAAGLEAFARGGVALTLARGQGLPGRVWVGGEPEWIGGVHDGDGVERSATPGGAPIRSAFAVPVRVGGEVAAVLAFGRRNARRPDDDLRMIADVAGQLGQFIERLHAQEALREREEQYRSLIANIPDVTWTAGENGSTVFVSPNIEGLLGFTADELYRGGDEFWGSRIHPDDARTVRAAREALFARDEAFDIEYRVRRKDGSWLWLHDRALKTYEKNGVKLADGIASDITLRKWAEEALGERVQQASLTAEVAVALTTADTLGAALQRCADAIVRYCDVTLARIWTLDRPASVLALRASAGLSARLDGDHSHVRLGELLVGRIAESLEPLLTNRFLDHPQVDADEARREGIAAFAGYPLEVDGQPVGVLAVFGRRPFGEDLLALLGAVADVLALGIDRKRAGEALRAVEDDLAARLLGPPLDLRETLAWLVKTARSLLGVDVVRVRLLDETGQGLRLLASVGTKCPESLPDAPAGAGFPGMVLSGRGVVAITDAPADPRIRYKDRFRDEGAASVLGVPLVIADRPVGVLSCWSRRRREWSPSDVRRAEIIASHASVAIANARLFEEAERRRQAAETFASVGRLVSRSLDVQEVAQRIVESICGLLSTPGGALRLVDLETGDLCAIAMSGALRGWSPRLPAGVALSGSAVELRKPLASANVLAEPGLAFTEETRRDLESTGFQAALAVPLIAKGHVIGTLTVGDRAGRVFNPEEIELAQAFADQAAIALDNARLYEELAARLDREQRLAAEVVAVARAREEFLLSVSHELGTPLTAIKAYVDTLRAEPALDLPTRQEFFAVLQAEVDRLARLIVNILDASKLEMGAFMLDLTTVDLAEVAASVVRDAQMRRPITCEIAGPLAVQGDRDRLKQVLVNLVDNAIKFSPVDQPVRVRAGREGAQAVVRVSDRGPGIPDEQIGHLFRKFSRLSRSGRGAPPGSGLGLYLASEIVKEHAGTLAAEHDGSDLVFVVRIPLLGEPGAGKEEPS